MLNKAFYYHNGQLHCEKVNLAEVTAAAGTPLYVYSSQQILENTARLKTAFADFDAHIHYSLKANANLSIIRTLHQAGLGMDAVSGGEIFRALKAGVDSSEIVFAGVGKTASELRYALSNGIGWFNVESLEELELLNQLAGETDQTAQVALRLNPEVQAKTHRYIATGHGGAKFGMSADVIQSILDRRADYPHVQVGGLHIHIGSQLGDVSATVTAVEHAQVLLANYPDMRTLNIGGGFPIAYSAADDYPPPEAFAKALKPLLTGWKIKLEPGRYIIANTGVLLISVLYNKDQGGKHFIITDGSMTELLRPALYEAVHPIYPVQQSDEPTQVTVVAGPVCETADILNHKAELPTLKTGEQLAITMAGAYGFVMASNYNQRPRPAEVLVEGDTWRIIRQRESWDDLIQHELD